MKKIVFFLTICAISFTAILVSCNQNEEDATITEFLQFPTYHTGLQQTPEVSSFVHQNCCECSTSGCSARKCCSGTNGGNCSCTCSSTWYGSHSCNCSGCSNQASYEIWLDQEQFGVYQEFNNILTQDGTPEALLARNELIETLKAIEQNNFDDFYTHRVAMGEYLPSLGENTKTLINNFLDTHDFEDDRL